MEWAYEVEPDIEGGYYHEEAHQNRRRSRLASEALYSAGKWVAKKAARHVLQAAWDRMAGKRKNTQLEDATKKAKSASGRTHGRSQNVSGIKPAMFMRGRGAEIPLVMNSFQKPIRLSLGVSGPSLTNAKLAMAMSHTYASKSVSTGFTFKAIKPYVAPRLDTGGTDARVRFSPDNTFITTHVFRHKDPRVMSGSMGQNSTLWNYTLAPDLSFNRRVPGVLPDLGTAFVPPTGFQPEFKSAERFPKSQKDCLPRYSIEHNEQNSWDLNPCKIISSTVDENPIPASAGLATASVYFPRAQPLFTFANTPPTPVPTSTSEQFGPQIFQSIPASQTCTKDVSWYSVPTVSTDPAQLFDVNIDGQHLGKEEGYFKVQSGTGHLDYTFSNNGSCAVVVDVVVTKLKQNSHIFDTTNFKNSVNERDGYWDSLKKQVQNGYVCSMRGADSASIMGGQNIDENTPITDMKHEFLPEKFFKQGLSPSQPTPLSGAGNGNVPSPKFSFIARDQFIISPGASKPWSTVLPSMSYDARKYRNFNPDLSDTNDTIPADLDAETPFPARVVYDDRAYALSWRFSNVSIPIAEKNKEADPLAPLYGTVAVIDRGATDVNVTCVGTYTERPAPCFKVKESSRMFNAGLLSVPFYTKPIQNPIEHIDIANSGQAVRDASQQSAYIQLGATNSQAA